MCINAAKGKYIKSMTFLSVLYYESNWDLDYVRILSVILFVKLIGMRCIVVVRDAYVTRKYMIFLGLINHTERALTMGICLAATFFDNVK